MKNIAIIFSFVTFLLLLTGGMAMADETPGEATVSESAPTFSDLNTTEIDRDSAAIEGTVSDPDGDNIDWIAFINADTGTLIENYTDGYSEPVTIKHYWTGLSENTTYNWKMKAADNNGNIGESSTETFTTEANISPEILLTSSTHDLIDRTNDTGDGIYETEIDIQVRDNNGYGDIDEFRISVLDSQNTRVVDNIIVTENTVIDENTLEFTYTYNPSDILPNDNLGQFDIETWVEDNYSKMDSETSENLFQVGGLELIYETTPVNNNLGFAHGFDANIYGRAEYIVSKSLVDSCESVWTYSETDSNDVIKGDQDNKVWSTEGSGSIMIGADGDFIMADDYGQFKKEIDLFGVNTLIMDTKSDGQSYNDNLELRIKIGSDLVYSRRTDTAWENTIEIDVSNYTSVENVKIIHYAKESNREMGNIWVDYLRTSTVLDTDNINIDTTDTDVYSTSGSGYDYTFTISSSPGETVNIEVSADNGPLDGMATSSFVVNDNRYYQTNIFEESTFDPMTDTEISNANLEAIAYGSAGTTTTHTLSEQGDNFVIDYTPKEIRIRDTDDNYYRTYAVFDYRDNVDAYMVQDGKTDDLYQYNITLEDDQDQWGAPDGRLLMDKYIDNVEGTIIDRYWLVGDEVNVYLLYNTRYNGTLKHPDSGTYSTGWIDANDDLTKIIDPPTDFDTGDLEFMKSINDSITWGLGWNNDNLLINYVDNSGGTNEVTIHVFHGEQDENVEVWTNTVSGNDWNVEYETEDNAGVYWVKLEIDHDIWGFSDYPISSTTLKEITTIPAPPGAGWVDDMPIAATNFALFTLFFILLLNNGPAIAGAGVMITSIIMAVLNVVLYIDIPWPIIGILFFVGVIMEIWEVKRE